MLRTNLYLTKEQNEEIARLAMITKKPKAAILRHVIGVGLKSGSLAVASSTAGLLELAQLADDLPDGGPKDLSANLDKYAWDE